MPALQGWLRSRGWVDDEPTPGVMQEFIGVGPVEWEAMKKRRARMPALLEG